MAMFLLFGYSQLLFLVLYQGVSLVSSETKTATFCFPLPLAASLSCDTRFIVVTKAHVGNIDEHGPGFCEKPWVGPEHRKYDERSITDMIRKSCNLLSQCRLDTMKGLSQSPSRYVIVEYWCTETDLPDSAYMNLFGDLTASGNEVIFQTMGYPSREIAATDISCDITYVEPIPILRLDIVDFASNSSEDSSYCIEWNGKLRKCIEKGAIISTFYGEDGNMILRKITKEPLTIRLMMTLIAIETADGLGTISPHPFSITCQPIRGDPLIPPARNTESRDSVPAVIGTVLPTFKMIIIAAAVIGIIIFFQKRNTAKECKGLETNFEGRFHQPGFKVRPGLKLRSGPA